VELFRPRSGEEDALKDADEAPAISVQGVTVHYGSQAALQDLSLAVPRGAVYALLGRNGAGKSSLVRCLLGLQQPDQGTVRIFSLDPWHDRPALMARVGVVPEEPDAPMEMTAAQLSRFCGRLHGARWDAPSVADRMRRFEVPMATPFGRMSKGLHWHETFRRKQRRGPDSLSLLDAGGGKPIVRLSEGAVPAVAFRPDGRLAVAEVRQGRAVVRVLARDGAAMTTLDVGPAESADGWAGARSPSPFSAWRRRREPASSVSTGPRGRSPPRTSSRPSRPAFATSG
jgi:hypothetical protein